MQNTVRYMRVGKGADCAAVAMLVNEALSEESYVSFQELKMSEDLGAFNRMVKSFHIPIGKLS